jgi:hypothetical protein
MNELIESFIAWKKGKKIVDMRRLLLPPVHHNCKCTLIPIDAKSAVEEVTPVKVFRFGRAQPTQDLIDDAEVTVRLFENLRKAD